MGDHIASPSAATVDADTVRPCLERILGLHEAIRSLRIEVELALCSAVDAKEECVKSLRGLDAAKFHAIDRLAKRPQTTLRELVQLIRGETTADPRPNKALRPADYARLLRDYEHVDFMIESATYGLQPRWTKTSPNQLERPPNHKSALQHKEALINSVRAGQDGGQYLVLDAALLDTWKDIQVSPLSAVEKPGKNPAVEVRLIHDLSYPGGESTNDATDRSVLPKLTYRPVAELARRIDALHARATGVDSVMMKGDVKAAFRHLMVDCKWVGWMAAALGWLGVFLVDLSAPFGWTSSPTYYGAYGGAVTWLVAHESPATMNPGDPDAESFFAYEWVDDHVLIEPHVGQRPALAAQALRLGMMAVFGPRALNEDKFSKWATRLEVLGLIFDTRSRTVSMPQRKIDKALGRVRALLAQSRTTKTGLRELLGSLRHVCTCCRAVKPFYQRLQALLSSAPARGPVSISVAVKQELQWLAELLEAGRFRDLPTTMFGAQPEPDIHLYMDASNAGLVVLDPARRRYIEVQFDDDEAAMVADVTGTAAFTINVREQLSVALAALVWGPGWSRRASGSVAQVRCWIDNSTAVAATNNLASKNPFAQQLNRAIGLAEAVYGFRASCSHVPGSANVMADAGMDSGRRPDAYEETLRATLRELQRSGLASSSTAKYQATWSQWVAWSAARRWSPWLERDQQQHSEQLVLFAIDCWRPPPAGRGNGVSTVLSKISHVAWRHRLDRGYSVGLHAGHLLALQGMRRLSSGPRAKAPATVPFLRALRACCDLSNAHDRVLWGAAVVGFFYLLRSGEYLCVNGRTSATIVTIADVTCRNAHGASTSDTRSTVAVELHLRGSKTDQEGRGVRLVLSKSGSGWLCPVLAVVFLLEHAKNLRLPRSSPLCSVTAGKTIKASTMIQRMRSAARRSGIDPGRVGTHSLRSGGATALLAAGVDSLALKQFGRWSSDCVSRYTRLTDEVSASMASRMAGKSPSPPVPRTGKPAGGTRLHAQPRAWGAALAQPGNEM